MLALEKLPDDLSEGDLDEVWTHLCRTDILAFTRHTYPEYQIAWHHRRLAKKLNDWVDGKIKYLMVFMPPRHGKSELVSRRLPAFLHGRYPNAEIFAASYLDSLAMDMCIDVQKIMDSKEYREIFPDTRIQQPRKVYTDGIRNSSEHSIHHFDENLGKLVAYPKGKYRGQGVGGSFTGRGANFIIVDDPIKGREVADSEAFRERLWNFWSNDLFTRLETNLETGRQGQVLITQTRWHEDDLSGRLLAQMKKKPDSPQFEIVHFPAIRINRDNPDDPRDIGDALWPEKYSLRQLEEIKAGTTPRGWTAVYQQDPVPGDGNHFKDRMFEFVDLPYEFDYMFTTADTAYTEKEESDFTCFSIWGVIGDDLYLVDIYHEQIESSQIEATVEPLIRGYVESKYGYRYTWIEPKGHGIYLNQAWLRKGLNIPDEETRKEFFRDRRFDKVERASNVIPFLAFRKVRVGKNIPFKEDLVAQCLGFPNATHDDFVDTLIDALKVVHWKAISSLDVV